MMRITSVRDAQMKCYAGIHGKGTENSSHIQVSNAPIRSSGKLASNTRNGLPLISAAQNPKASSIGIKSFRNA